MSMERLKLKFLSLPDTFFPVRFMYWAKALIPNPAIPTKKTLWIFYRDTLIWSVILLWMDIQLI